MNIWSILMSLSISWIQVMINISGQDQYIRSVYIFTIYRYIFHLTVYKCCHIHTLRPRKNNCLFPLTRPTLVFFFLFSFFIPRSYSFVLIFYGEKKKILNKLCKYHSLVNFFFVQFNVTSHIKLYRSLLMVIHVSKLNRLTSFTSQF